jgi:hypothetical protein
MEVKLRFPETPKFSDDPASRFLDYYERYFIAKGQQNAEMIWLCAISEVSARLHGRWLASKTEHCPEPVSTIEITSGVIL